MTALHYSTKGQIQIIETILVLFIFLLILVFGIYMYYQYAFSDVQEESSKLSEQQATTLVSSITNLPELSCTYEKDCVDIIKLLNFKFIYNQNKAHYATFFKNKKISIQQIYPEITQDNCQFQNIFPIQCEEIIIHQSIPKSYTSKSIVSLPTLINYPTQDKNALGKVIIEVYK